MEYIVIFILGAVIPFAIIITILVVIAASIPGQFSSYISFFTESNTKYLVVQVKQNRSVLMSMASVLGFRRYRDARKYIEEHVPLSEQGNYKIYTEFTNN